MPINSNQKITFCKNESNDQSLVKLKKGHPLIFCNEKHLIEIRKKKSFALSTAFSHENFSFKLYSHISY